MATVIFKSTQSFANKLTYPVGNPLHHGEKDCQSDYEHCYISGSNCLDSEQKQAHVIAPISGEESDFNVWKWTVLRPYTYQVMIFEEVNDELFTLSEWLVLVTLALIEIWRCLFFNDNNMVWWSKIFSRALKSSWWCRYMDVHSSHEVSVFLVR